MSNINRKYRQRSLYLNTNSRIKNYSSPDSEKTKSLREIQIDEIRRIMKDDPKKFKFFQLFANPIIANLDKSKYSFDLKQKIQFKISESNERMFRPIIESMIQVFKKDIRELNKISSEQLTKIKQLKNELFSKVQQAQASPDKQSLLKKFREFALKIKQKFKGQQGQEQQVELENDKLITDEFYKIITTLQNLRQESSTINIAVIINKFFTIKIGDIFGKFPEFTRDGPLKNLLNIQCRFNLLSFAVFLGIEPLVILFLLLGGDPSLTNQYNQDASYQLLFFQMNFRNIAMNVGWKPSDKDETNTKYQVYDPQIQSKILSYEKLISNIQGTEKLLPENSQNKEILKEFSNYLRQQVINKEKQSSTVSETKSSENLTIEGLQKQIEELKKMIMEQAQQKESQEFQKFKQTQSQSQSQQQKLGNQAQPAETQQPQFKFYNFDWYLFNNNKLIRMLTLLSIFGCGIDLSRLVPQTDIAQIYVAGNNQFYPERTKSSVLISMAKDKFLNEKNILDIDSKYVKYSVYDLLRYFLIFNGFDSSNFIKYITGNIEYTRNNSNLNNDDFITRASRGQQSSLDQQSLIEQLKKNKLINTELILTKNPFKFISNINETSKPFNYSFFFYLIANKGISSDHKLELGCIALLQGADPNIMPNISQNLLSQIDPKLRLCDIFKMFLVGNYETVIRIFKLYSTEFNRGEWDDKLGDILKKLYAKNEIIKRLEREKLSLAMSSNLRRRTDSNFSFSKKPSSDKSFFSRVSSLFTEESPILPTEEISQQSIVRSVPLLPPRNLPMNSTEQIPQQSMLTSVPLSQPTNLSMLTSVPTKQKINSRMSVRNLVDFYEKNKLVGGSKIKLRTFHFLEPKSYNEHAFRAEKPIIAGKMAYDFLRTHYKLKKGSSIMFTIEDRIKDRKYNYIGEKVNNKIIIKST